MRRLLILPVILGALWLTAQSVPFPGPGAHSSAITSPAITYVNSTSAGATNPGLATTTAINTTGANFLIVLVNLYQGTGSVSDSTTACASPCNSWTLQGTYNPGGPGAVFQVYYAFNPTVGPGHVFNTTTSSGYPSMFVGAFAGVTGTSLDKFNHSSSSSTNTVSAGSITPSLSNELVITGFCSQSNPTSGTITVTSGYGGQLTQFFVNNYNEAGGFAYQIQTTATATNPTWSWTGNANTAALAVVISFE